MDLLMKLDYFVPNSLNLYLVVLNVNKLVANYKLLTDNIYSNYITNEFNYCRFELF